MELVEILTVILLISASVLCIALIYFLYQIVKSVHSFSLNVKALSFKLDPLIESVIELSEKINSVTDEVESQIQIVRSMITDVKDRIDKILNVESKIRDGITNTVMPTIKNINAVGIGVSSFWKSYKLK
jgi:uncharacterized protein YoxC